jgi:hypothetical protein
LATSPFLSLITSVLGFWVARREHAAHADERFGIAGVRCGVDPLDDGLRQDALAADVSGGWGYRVDRSRWGFFWHIAPL